MPRWTERTDAIRVAIEAEDAEQERLYRLRRLDEINRLGPATHKDGVIFNHRLRREFRPQWWRQPRYYGTPRASFGLGRAATNKALRLPRWRLKRGVRIGVLQGGAPR